MDRKGINLTDVLLGLGAILVAAAYLYGAAQIPQSMLSDEVGAAGMPRALGWIMVVTGTLIAVRGMLARAAEQTPDADERQVARRAHLLALGLLVITVAYLLVTPYAGFGISVGLLVGAVAWYAGARFDRTLVITTVLAGLGFWIAFSHLLGINMPVSVLFEGR